MLTMLSLLAVTANAFVWMEMDYDMYSPLLSYPVRNHLAPRWDRYASPYWSANEDAYELNMRLPDLEPQTVSASLASDGKKIEVAGERKIEGCSCRPTSIKEIDLPYRPRAEDVDISMKDGMLSIRLARQADASAATPLKVKLVEEPKEKEAEAPADASQTRPLRFVPHASATDAKKRSVDEQEKSLTDKFRSAALASVATTYSAHATTAERGAEGAEAAAAVEGVVEAGGLEASSANEPTPTGNAVHAPAAA